ncbi:MAG: FkbM family methyltransferase [Terracidiphilus sp.]
MARSSIRSIAPRRTYAALSHSLDWSLAFRTLGWRQSRLLWRMRASHAAERTADLFSISSLNLSHPFYIRSGTSDVDEFIYTVVRETYGRHLPPYEAEFVFDAGANMGDTAAWLLTRYPKARLIAVEPDPENFRLLSRNCVPYGERSIPVQAAVWPRPARLSLRSDQAKDAIQVLDTGDGDCLGMTIPELMEKYDFPRLDIFKCDIEGAELELFSFDADQWLSRTGFLVIEVHGPECLNAVLNATSRHGFIHRSFRNLHIFGRHEWTH